MGERSAHQDHATDIELLESLASGRGDDRETAAKLLFDRYYRTLIMRLTGVFRGLTAEDAEEIAADTMLQIIEWPDRYDPNAASLETYLTVIARSRVLDLIRRQRGILFVPLSTTLNVPAKTRATTSNLARSPWQDRLFSEIRSLPPASRAATHLHLQGMTAVEIAAHLDCEPGTVRTRLSRARAELRRRVSTGGDKGL